MALQHGFEERRQCGSIAIESIDYKVLMFTMIGRLYRGNVCISLFKSPYDQEGTKSSNGRNRQQQHHQRHASTRNVNTKEIVQLNFPQGNKHHGGQQKHKVSNTRDQKRQDANTTLTAISHFARKKDSTRKVKHDSTRKVKHAHSGQHNHSKGVAPVNTHPPMPMPGRKKDHRPSHNDTNDASDS
jgi:hypothetical protein